MPTLSRRDPSRFDPGLPAGLDEPVRRYLDHAVRDGAPPTRAVRLTMRGRIRAGVWLPFTAKQLCDGRSFVWQARVGCGAFTPLEVVDRFAAGAGSTSGRLFGRRTLFHADSDDTSRSAAGRAAGEAVFAPTSLLPGLGVAWRAESEKVIVASWNVPPERPELRLGIDERGGVRSISLHRWGDAGRKTYGYIPFGGDVHAERRFGALVVPSRFTVGWGFGTPQYKPFFEADILELVPAG